MPISKTIQETHNIAKEFVNSLKPNSHKATIVALQGDLGSGKTAFVQGMAQALGITGSVLSPTFVLQKIYSLENKKFKHLIHIDAYRMESVHELNHIGWHELIKDPENLVCIEWPERVKEEIPRDAIFVQCKFIDEETHAYDFPPDFGIIS
jgi:tRNA threonylcarbamoyladenosine biosynthesis protein TsaE